jgi:uroporphyrinogen decarboxylase
MRQAGRYMPEYRAVKERFASILDMVKDPAVATEITLQPVNAFPWMPRSSSPTS